MAGTLTGLSSALGEQRIIRLETLLRAADSICRGGKPVDYPPVLTELLVAMCDIDFQYEAPASYVYLPGETPSDELKSLKGLTWVHPISENLALRHETLMQATQPEGLHNLKVLGLDPHFRLLSHSTGMFEKHDPLEICEDAAALIMTRGDMHVLREGLQILMAKLTGDMRVGKTTLVIQNTQGFWSPLLEYLGFTHHESRALAGIGVYITSFPGGLGTEDTQGSTLQVLKSLGDIMSHAPRPDRMDAVIKPGDDVYVITGAQHKPGEIRNSFQALRALVRVGSHKLDIKPRQAAELMRSVEGNNIDKFLGFHAHINEKMGFEHACRNLCRPGKGPESVWVVFDDRSLDFVDPRITRTRAFDKVRAVLNPYENRPAPGAELAPMFHTTGFQYPFEKMLPAAIEEIREEYGEDPDLTVVDGACHIMARLDWFLEREPKYVGSFAKRRAFALTKPSPVVDARNRPIKTYQTDHFLAPLAFNTRDTPAAEVLTKAAITGYIENDSEIAGSIRTMASLTGIARHREAMKDFNLSFNSAAQNGQKLNIATMHTLFPAIYGHGVPHFYKLIKSALNGRFQLMSGKTRRYDILETAIEEKGRGHGKVRMTAQHAGGVDNVLQTLRRLYQDSDGFIFTPDNKELLAIPGIRWLKMSVYFSQVVGRQVDDRDINDKFAAVFAEKNPSSWLVEDRIYGHLARTPGLLSRIEDLIHDHTDRKTLTESLKKFAGEYIRPAVLEKEVVNKDGNVPVPSDLFRVTIYSSATIERDTDACRGARNLAFNLACNGFAVINGGGEKGLMYATSEGVHLFRRWARNRIFTQGSIPRNHVASYQSHDTFEREGGWHADNDFACIFKNIEQRMANLMNTDGEVLMAGGAGSVQEFAVSMLMREWGLVPVANRPMIIVNQIINGIRMYDALAADLSRNDRERLNIHVVDTEDQALGILARSRLKLRHELGKDAIYVPRNDNIPRASIKDALNFA